MSFNVEFQDRKGNTIDFNRLDEEVCELWGIVRDDNRWATPPGKQYDNNWHELSGRIDQSLV